MDLSILDRSLAVSENPGLETTDERLDDIATLAQDGDFAGAAGAAQGVFEEEIYDVRLLGIFFYGVFLELGIAALRPVMQTLQGVLENNWPAFGPTAHKEKQTQTALRWFLNQLLKKLEHEEQTKGKIWEEWVGALGADQVREALEAVEAVRQVLGQTLQEAAGPLTDGLGKVGQWLQSFQQVVSSAKDDTAPGAEEELQEGPPDIGPGEEKGAPLSIPGEDQSQSCAEGSYRLQELIRKMDAFAHLIEGQKYPAAAVVVDDVNEIIGNFDPRIFFPKLFSRYLHLLALNIGELSKLEENKESAEWQVMKAYYQADLDGFVNL